MRDFSSEYQSKKTTAAELASRVQSGWLIGMDSAASHTPFIMAEIAKRARNGELTGVKVQSLLDVYPMDMFADNSLFGRLQCESWFTGGGGRKAVNGGYEASCALFCYQDRTGDNIQVAFGELRETMKPVETSLLDKFKQ